MTKQNLFEKVSKVDGKYILYARDVHKANKEVIRKCQDLIRKKKLSLEEFNKITFEEYGELI